MRKDTGQWALPGGMTDPTDKNAAQTAMRELAEEAGVILEEEALTEVYAGIVDDPRNTDNAWMETKALCAVAEGERPEPTAGDDAQKAKWVNVADLTKDGLMLPR
jgi:ADP-ribose pyrophosphatase